MTFTIQIKEELTQNEYTDNQLKCLLSAFLKNNITINISNNKITYETKIKNNKIIRFVTQALSKLFKIQKTLSFSKGVKFDHLTTYKLEFDADQKEIEEKLFIFKDPSPLFNDEYDKQAFLIGAFLSGGSINHPSSSNYHFEIRSHNVDLINDLVKVINYFNIEVKTMQRKNIYVLYVKKSESISDLLKYMNANNSMFEYEEKRMYRDYSNQMHRLNNLDVSNLKKTVDASTEQIKWINLIKEHNDLFESLSFKEKIFCELRLKYNQATLNEMVDYYLNEYNIVVTRTGLNHYVRKIRSIYNRLTSNDK